MPVQFFFFFYNFNRKDTDFVMSMNYKANTKLSNLYQYKSVKITFQLA